MTDLDALIERVQVYTASKLKHGPRWQELAAQCEDIGFTATWPTHVANQVPDTPENAAWFWLEDVADVRRADAVLVYAEPGEHLRGALVEAGIGIATGKTVIVVGDHPDYGTWQYHPAVKRVADLPAALAFLRALRATGGGE